MHWILFVTATDFCICQSNFNFINYSQLRYSCFKCSSRIKFRGEFLIYFMCSTFIVFNETLMKEKKFSVSKCAILPTTQPCYLKFLGNNGKLPRLGSWHKKVKGPCIKNHNRKLTYNLKIDKKIAILLRLFTYCQKLTM